MADSFVISMDKKGRNPRRIRPHAGIIAVLRINVPFLRFAQVWRGCRTESGIAEG
jgi:hypothetical protein